MRHLAVFLLYVTDPALLFFIPNPKFKDRRRSDEERKQSKFETKRMWKFKITLISQSSDYKTEDTYIKIKLDYVKVVSFYKILVSSPHFLLPKAFCLQTFFFYIKKFPIFFANSPCSIWYQSFGIGRASKYLLNEAAYSLT